MNDLFCACGRIESECDGSRRACMKRQTRRLARDLAQTGAYTDGTTGEVNATALAEDVAEELDRDHWLDDETHFLWEVALEEAERATPAFRGW